MKYVNTQLLDIIDWTTLMDMRNVYIVKEDRDMGSPKIGDKIATNPKGLRWLVPRKEFLLNYRLAVLEITDWTPETDMSDITVPENYTPVLGDKIVNNLLVSQAEFEINYEETIIDWQPELGDIVIPEGYTPVFGDKVIHKFSGERLLIPRAEYEASDRFESISISDWNDATDMKGVVVPLNYTPAPGDKIIKKLNGERFLVTKKDYDLKYLKNSSKEINSFRGTKETKDSSKETFVNWTSSMSMTDITVPRGHTPVTGDKIVTKPSGEKVLITKANFEKNYAHNRT